MRLEEIRFKREYKDLSEIKLSNEIKRVYDYYPKGLVNHFIRRGIISVYDMKVFLEGEISIRNVGPKRRQMAMQLVKKYEDEAII